jgi:hypothetical protein
LSPVVLRCGRFHSGEEGTLEEYHDGGSQSEIRNTMLRINQQSNASRWGTRDAQTS